MSKAWLSRFLNHSMLRGNQPKATGCSAAFRLRSLAELLSLESPKRGNDSFQGSVRTRKNLCAGASRLLVSEKGIPVPVTGAVHAVQFPFTKSSAYSSW